ncbi:MAG: PTS sugar transporter subunit IIA [Salinibacterium sp.]|nr:PTS sugar transporter subunit IIA [Salinibacterium sp.]
MSGLEQLVRPELVSITPTVTTAEQVIRTLADLLVAGGFAAPTLADAAVAREAGYPTGLLLGGDGTNAAIPHADSEHVTESAVAVAVLDHPVDFHRMDAPDEAIPVRVVALLALADADSQLATLRQIAALLQDPARIAALAAARTADGVIAALAAGKGDE